MSDEEQWKDVDDYMSKGVFFDNTTVTGIQTELDHHKERKNEIVADACKWDIHAKNHKTYDSQQEWVRENKDAMQQSNDEAIQNAIQMLVGPIHEWFLTAYVGCRSIVVQNAQEKLREAAYKRDTVVGGKLTSITEETHFVLMRACLQRMMQIRNEISEV